MSLGSACGHAPGLVGGGGRCLSGCSRGSGCCAAVPTFPPLPAGLQPLPAASARPPARQRRGGVTAHQRPTALTTPLCRLDEAVRELPVAAAALEAPLAAAGLAAGPEPLARHLQLRELQQAYVLHTLLAKKARVSGHGMRYLPPPGRTRCPGRRPCCRSILALRVSNRCQL